MKLLSLVLISSFMSCSTLKKSLIYPGAGGAIAGAVGGFTLSDEDKGHDKGANALIWGTLSGLIASGIGYLIYKDHPENQKLNHAMNIEESIDPIEEARKELKLNHSQTIQLQADNEEVIPEELRGKLKRPKVKIFDVPERIIEEDGKQMIIEKTRGFKYVIE